MSASESSVIPTTPRTEVIAAAPTAVVVPEWIIKVHAIVNVTAVVAIPSKRTMAMINSDSVSTSRQSPPLTLALQQSGFSFGKSAPQSLGTDAHEVSPMV
jgi:hypothetical protein